MSRVATVDGVPARLSRREFALLATLAREPTRVFTKEELLRELARVPYGQTDTYGHLASLVGRPRAARAVGMVMNRNPIPIVLPCHRIVGADGSLTGYGGGLPAKQRLLELEGAILGISFWLAHSAWAAKTKSVAAG